MTPPHKFEIVNHCGIELFRESSEVIYADWLVVLATGCDDGLYEETKAHAFGFWLQERHGLNAASILDGTLGETIVAINPENDAAIASAVNLASEVEQGLHLNIELYNIALDEAVDDHWSDLELSERIALMRQYREPGESLALALKDTPPASVRAILEERFEN